jgi:hypothetical protein
MNQHPYAIQRQAVLTDLLQPSHEAPGLSKGTVTEANELLKNGKCQEAVDIIVDDMVQSKQIDRSLLEGGKVNYEPRYEIVPSSSFRDYPFFFHTAPRVIGEGETDPQRFRRGASGSLSAVRMPIYLGRKAFSKGISWLYSTILHEYQHLLQSQTPAGLATISSAVPGQHGGALDYQQDVETYATEILAAKKTGLAMHPPQIIDLWTRLHRDKWSMLSMEGKEPVEILYCRAHKEAEAIRGVGTLPFSPLRRCP